MAAPFPHIAASPACPMPVSRMTLSRKLVSLDLLDKDQNGLLNIPLYSGYKAEDEGGEVVMFLVWKHCAMLLDRKGEEGAKRD